MKVIVGLGNPGRKYLDTRHNVGFEVVEELVRRTGATSARTKFEALVWDAVLAGERVLLVCPQTYMNLSGRAIQPILAFHKLAATDLLVICDDLNLPSGKLRLRKNGSAGGQKGLQHTIDLLGTTEFPRLRIGIDRPPPQMDAAAYVLQKFGGRERELITTAVWKAAEGVELIVREGLDQAMNVLNAEPRAPRDPRNSSESA